MDNVVAHCLPLELPRAPERITVAWPSISLNQLSCPRWRLAEDGTRSYCPPCGLRVLTEGFPCTIQALIASCPRLLQDDACGATSGGLELDKCQGCQWSEPDVVHSVQDRGLRPGKHKGVQQRWVHLQEGMG